MTGAELTRMSVPAGEAWKANHELSRRLGDEWLANKQQLLPAFPQLSFRIQPIFYSILFIGTRNGLKLSKAHERGLIYASSKTCDKTTGPPGKGNSRHIGDR